LNWIIAKGIYIEDIQQNINIEKKALENRVKKQIKQNIFFFLFFSLIAIIITYIIGKKIQSIIYEKDKKVKSTTKALAKLNKELDTRVKTEVEKNKEQQKILMQKSKFVAMGEMISLIAHQWRQPISEINAIILNMKLHYDLGKLDKKQLGLIEEYAKSTGKLQIHQMSSEQTEAWKKAVSPIYSKFYSKKKIGKELIEGAINTK
jgi:C4-dicarboxylate-specific signal transduction histidine kinase